MVFLQNLNNSDVFFFIYRYYQILVKDKVFFSYIPKLNVPICS
jgi:hypothetical protein